MGQEIQQFSGDASPLIAEFQKVIAKMRQEAQQRRKNETESKRQAREFRGRVRDQIRQSSEQRAATQAAGKTAADAARMSIRSTSDYAKALRIQKQALDAGIISLDQFRQRKERLKAALQQLKSEQSGENALLREADKILQQTRSSTDRYKRGIEALNLALKKGKIDQQQYDAAVRQLTADIRGAETAQRSWAASMLGTVGALTGMASGVAVVLRVVAQLREEYQRLIETQREAADAQRPLAAIQSQAVKNLGVDKEFDAKKLFDVVRQKSQELGIDEADLTAAVSDALSARGKGTARDALNSVLAAAKFERFGGRETLATLAGSSSDIKKRTGMTDEASLGFLSQIGQLSRVTRTEELSRNIAPAVVNALSSGVSKEFAGAMVAALSQGIVDQTGRVSRTGLTSVITALEKFDPGANIEETFNRLLNDRQARQQFFQDNSFEKKALFAVRDLFTRGSTIHQTFTQGQQTLRQNSAQGQFDSVVSQTESLESVQVARLEQFLKNTERQSQLANVEGAISGVIRDELDGIRKALGKSGFGSKIAQMVEDIDAGGELGVDSLKGGLEGELRDLRFDKRTKTEFQDGMVVAGGTELVARDMSNAERKQAVIINDLLRRLDQLAPIVAQAPADAVVNADGGGIKPGFRADPDEILDKERQANAQQDAREAAAANDEQRREARARQLRQQQMQQDAQTQRLRQQQQQRQPQNAPQHTGPVVAQMSRAEAERFLGKSLGRFVNLPGDDVKAKASIREEFRARLDGGQEVPEAIKRSIVSHMQSSSERLSQRDASVMREILREVDQPVLTGQQDAAAAVPFQLQPAEVDPAAQPQFQRAPAAGVGRDLPLISEDPLRLIQRSSNANGITLNRIFQVLDERLPAAGGGAANASSVANERRTVQRAGVANSNARRRFAGRNGGL